MIKSTIYNFYTIRLYIIKTKTEKTNVRTYRTVYSGDHFVFFGGWTE